MMIAIQSMDLVLLGLFFDRVSGFFGILELAMPPLRILKDSCDLSVANQDSLRSLETLLRPCGTSMLENIFIVKMFVLTEFRVHDSILDHTNILMNLY